MPVIPPFSQWLIAKAIQTDLYTYFVTEEYAYILTNNKDQVFTAVPHKSRTQKFQAIRDATVNTKTFYFRHLGFPHPDEPENYLQLLLTYNEQTYTNVVRVFTRSKPNHLGPTNRFEFAAGSLSRDHRLLQEFFDQFYPPAQEPEEVAQFKETNRKSLRNIIDNFRTLNP
jgi:hypothetical protein